MSLKWSAVGLYCVLVFNLGPSLRNTKADCIEELDQAKVSCQIYQSKALLAVKQIFDEEQQCPPCSDFSNEAKDDELKQSKAINAQRLDRNFKTVLAALTSQKLPAQVLQPMVTAEVNTSVHFSCASTPEHSLTLCVWERNKNGQRESMVIDKQVEEDEGRRISDGISVFGGGLQNGTCGVTIHSMRNEDFGNWSCTLMATGGEVFAGAVDVVEVQKACLLPPSIGDCAIYTERYHFDAFEGRCKVFVYSSCGGNANNFLDVDECRNKCGQYAQSRPADVLHESVAVDLHPNCTDNPFFANCKLTVKTGYCTKRYYDRFCCKSCTHAGQLPALGAHLQPGSMYRRRH